MLLHVKHPPCSPARALGATCAKMSWLPQGLSHVQETPERNLVFLILGCCQSGSKCWYGSLKDTMKHQNLVDKFFQAFPLQDKESLPHNSGLIGETLRVTQEMEDSLKYFVSLSTAKIVFTKKCTLFCWWEFFFGWQLFFSKSVILKEQKKHKNSKTCREVSPKRGLSTQSSATSESFSIRETERGLVPSPWIQPEIEFLHLVFLRWCHILSLELG